MIFMVSWVPTFIRMTSGSTTAAGTSLGMWNIGSLIATALVGQLIDRFGYYRVLIPAFAIIAVVTWLLGALVTAPVTVVVLCIATVGFFVGGSNSGLMALACRAAGIDRSVFMTVFNLSRQARGASPSLSAQDHAEIDARFPPPRDKQALAMT